MISYLQERRAFDRLRSDCNPDTKTEYESAVRILVERYNTTIYENRFIVGGAVEYFTYALLRSVGISCSLYSDEAQGGDILLPNMRKLSVKSTFTGPNSIKLINQLGEGARTWDTATLFVVADVGIVYGDPNMVDRAEIRSTGDGVELRRRGLMSLVEEDSNVFQIEIARKPPTETTGFSQKASTAVARQILLESDADRLRNALEGVREQI